MATQKNNKLLDDVKRVMRLKHYSIHTERIYCDWIKQYVTQERGQALHLTLGIIAPIAWAD